jgi:polar amino acid transport system permease protein
VPIFTLVLLMYLAMSLCITIGMRALERRASRGIVRARAQ